MWQPIESAPKDRDSEFIGWDGSIIDKTWVGWYLEDGVPAYVRSEWLSWSPTHWMPLPAPPQEQQ